MPSLKANSYFTSLHALARAQGEVTNPVVRGLRQTAVDGAHVSPVFFFFLPHGGDGDQACPCASTAHV